MTSDEDDYFGINIVQKTPVPQHLLKQKSSEFFDEAFFPGLSDESPEHLETAEDYQPVNVFEEQFFGKADQRRDPYNSTKL